MFIVGPEFHVNSGPQDFVTNTLLTKPSLSPVFRVCVHVCVYECFACLCVFLALPQCCCTAEDTFNHDTSINSSIL